MSNDISENKPAEESIACIALSKNDSYVMSASGGKVSLFNVMTFKVSPYHFLLLCDLKALFISAISNCILVLWNQTAHNFLGHDNIHVPSSCCHIFSIPSSG